MFKTIQECNLQLVSHSGSDFMPCSAARVSFGHEDKTGRDEAADIKLLNYLAKNRHMSPFEHQSATFLVEVPLFIRSQIHRHRTFAYNEISRRYTDENLEFWIPDTCRKQSNSNRQASTNEVVESIPAPDTPANRNQQMVGYPDSPVSYFKESARLGFTNYNLLVEGGVCREQARAVLPQSLLTKFYMTGNLRNWAHFLSLRLDEHSQYEVRVVAQKISDDLSDLWPNSMKALMENM
jgi:thymidylate synthase (FAD)